jgi:hypothetical protein
MKHCVVAIWDEKLQAFIRPWFAPRLGGAVRAFSDEVHRKDSEMNAHAEDYSLFELGEFDDETGQFSCFDIPRKVISAQGLMDLK